MAALAATISSRRFLVATLRATASSVLLTGLVISLYLAKSAMGINLMVARSPLHDYLYHLVK